jgi:hypothetical protein
MGAASEHELISRAAQFALDHAAETQNRVHEALQSSGATSLVNTTRMLTMLRAVIAIGSFSIFESVLQQQTGWGDPFAEVDQCLRKIGKEQLADRFVDYRNAINVLKHGKGRSYEALLKRGSALEFPLKVPDQSFFREGDVSEGLTLVKADDEFGRRCADIIQEVADALKPIVELR